MFDALANLQHACRVFLWTAARELVSVFNLPHTPLGQTIERAYLRAALPNIRAFEIESLPVTGVDVPLDELVEVGPEVALAPASFAGIEFPPFKVVSVPLTECRTCHKPVDVSGLCEPCAFEELSKGVGA